MVKIRLATGLALLGLALASCTSGPPHSARGVEQALAAFQVRQSAWDLAQCAQTHGDNAKSLNECVGKRTAVRKAQVRELREALRERQLRTGQTSCRNPITLADEMCQEL